MYDAFDPLISQFLVAVHQRGRGISAVNLNEFFQTCRNHYVSIENSIRTDVTALKILVRMMAPLPINGENMLIGSEAAQLMVSITLQNLKRNFQAGWTAISESEWISFREGLVILSCIRLYHQDAGNNADCPLDLLPMICDQRRQQDVADKLVNFLGDLGCTLPKHQEVILFTLIGQNILTLKHLEMTRSLDTYVGYVAQLLTSHQNDSTQLEGEIQLQLDTLIPKNHFASKNQI